MRRLDTARIQVHLSVWWGLSLFMTGCAIGILLAGTFPQSTGLLFFGLMLGSVLLMAFHVRARMLAEDGVTGE